MSGRTYFERLSQDPRVLNKAWKEVKRNARLLSKGIDNTTLEAYAEESQKNLTSLRLRIRDGSFSFSDLKGTAILKPNGKYRPLKIATIEDRVVQKAIEQLIRKRLNDTYNLFNNPVSYAFIKTEDINDYDSNNPQTYKGVRGAIEKVQSYISSDYSWCLKADIIDYFGNVDVERLLGDFIYPALAPDESLNTLIKNAFLQEVKIEESVRKILAENGEDVTKYLINNGLPQGSILSPLFSNVYLSSFDTEVSDDGLIVIRYVDDFIIMSKSKDEAIAAYKSVANKLDRLGLKIHDLNSQKTVIQETDDITFLGIRLKSGGFYPSDEAFTKVINKLTKYPRYKSLFKNIQSLKMLTESWASTYYFCSNDTESYDRANQALSLAVERSLKKARLIMAVKMRSRELRRLGIYQFDNAVSLYNQKHSNIK
jgi:retron-type reverse transcriptase